MESDEPAVRLDDHLDDEEEELCDKADDLGSRLLINSDRSLISVADYSYSLSGTAAALVINGSSFPPVVCVASQRGCLVVPLLEPWAVAMTRAAGAELGDELSAVLVHGHFHQVMGPVPTQFRNAAEEEAWKLALSVADGAFQPGQTVTQLFPFVYGQPYEGEVAEVIFTGAYRSGLEYPSAALWRLCERLSPSVVGISLPKLAVPFDGFSGLLGPSPPAEAPLRRLAVRLMDLAAQSPTARVKVTGANVWDAMSQ